MNIQTKSLRNTTDINNKMARMRRNEYKHESQMHEHWAST